MAYYLMLRSHPGRNINYYTQARMIPEFFVGASARRCSWAPATRRPYKKFDRLMTWLNTTDY
jgi:hypothetical protein